MRHQIIEWMTIDADSVAYCGGQRLIGVGVPVGTHGIDKRQIKIVPVGCPGMEKIGSADGRNADAAFDLAQAAAPMAIAARSVGAHNLEIGTAPGSQCLTGGQNALPVDRLACRRCGTLRSRRCRQERGKRHDGRMQPPVSRQSRNHFSASNW